MENKYKQIFKNQVINFINDLILVFPNDIFIEKVIDNENAIAVKLSLTGGGCAGFEYKWDTITEFYSNTDYTHPTHKSHTRRR